MAFVATKRGTRAYRFAFGSYGHRWFPISKKEADAGILSGKYEMVKKGKGGREPEYELYNRGRTNRKRRNPTLQLVGVPARLLRGLRSRNPFDWATVATGIASGAGAAVGGHLISRALRGRKTKRRNSGTSRSRVRANPPGQKWSARLLPAPAAKRFPGYAAAATGYRKFHGAGHDPGHTFLVRLKDGSKSTTRRAVFTVGEAPEVNYQTLKGVASNKATTKGGRRIVWRHLFGEGAGGKKPLLVHDPKSGVSSYIGGAYRVADWFHK